MRTGLHTWGIWLALAAGVAAAEPVLQRSDVVFMYQADRETYEQYGATVLAWGGTPTNRSKTAAHLAGVKFFASVGMVTEFSRYFERFPQTYEEGLCRDIDGQLVSAEETQPGCPTCVGSDLSKSLQDHPPSDPRKSLC